MKSSQNEFNVFLFDGESPELDSMLCNCGHQLVSSMKYRWHGLSRGLESIGIWQYTLAGEGALRVGDEYYRLTPGRAMLVKVPEDHCYYLPESSGSWEFIFISFNGAGLLELLEQFRRRHGSVLEHRPDSVAVKTVQKLLLKCRGGTLNRFNGSATAYRFMMELFEEFEVAEHGDADSAFMHRIREFVLDNMNRSLGVEDLAEFAGCTRSHFSRKFSRLCGKTPHRFIFELRMQWAARLLHTSSKSIKEIGAACGFEQSGYFARVFRSFYNMTPGAFRNVKM